VQEGARFVTMTISTGAGHCVQAVAARVHQDSRIVSGIGDGGTDIDVSAAMCLVQRMMMEVPKAMAGIFFAMLKVA
jgi:hypothetical protein